MAQQCFVIMAIGEFPSGKKGVSPEELWDRYTTFLKEALLKSRPTLEVVRADEVSEPGTITTDIFTRLMHADYVVADVSFPSPNVLYELGLRHACKTGTMVIRDKKAPQAPFDIRALRHFEYEHSPRGTLALAEYFKKQLAWIDEHPSMPDNEFLRLAKVMKFKLPDYAENTDQTEQFLALMELMSDPGLKSIFDRAPDAGPLPPAELAKLLVRISRDKNKARALIKLLAASGSLPNLGK